MSSRPLIRVKDIAWLIYLYPARLLARILPLRWLYALADAAAACGPALLRRPRRAIEKRLAVAFCGGAVDSRARALARQCLHNAILQLFDNFLRVDRFKNLAWRDVELVHLEYLEKALSAGRGAMLVSGHQYASGMAMRYLASMGFTAMAVRRFRPYGVAVGRFGMRFLQRRYVAFLNRGARNQANALDPACTLKMLAHLRASGLVFLHIDGRDSLERVPYNFFGVERNFPTGFLHVAKLARCPLIPMSCLGNSRRLRIEFEQPVWIQDTPDRKEFIDANLLLLVRVLEHQVAAHPADYFPWVRW